MYTPKDTTSLLVEDVGISASLEDWIIELNSTTQKKFKEWILLNGQALLGDSKVTASKLSKVTGLPKYHFYNYIYNGKFPRRESAEIIAKSFGFTLEEMISDIGAKDFLLWRNSLTS